MDIWEPEKIILFLSLFMPGFISIKVYESIIATKRTDFKNSFLEAIGYSVLNFAALSWLIILISAPGFNKSHSILYSLSIVFIFLIFPICWPIMFIWISKRKFFSKYILNPIKMPWDEVFSKRKAYWVIIHLKNGRKVGGKYTTKSRASAFPNQRQIYLEELWQLEQNGSFLKPIGRSQGALFFEDEISIIEFFS